MGTVVHDRHEDERNRWYRMGVRVGRLVGTVRRRPAPPATPVTPLPAPPPAPERTPARPSTPASAPARHVLWVPAARAVVVRARSVPHRWPGPAGSQLVLGGVRLARLIARGASGPAIALELARLVWDVLVADRVAPGPGVAIARALLG